MRPLCEDVRERGVDALLDLTERFDGVRPAGIRVPAGRARRGARAARPRRARRRSRSRSAAPGWCTASRCRPATSRRSSPAARVTQRWVPVGRVGLYVPGGLAVYPSSVVMNVVAGAGGRRRLDRRREPAAAREPAGLRGPAQPDDPRRVRPARRRRGLRRRGRPGRRDVRLRRQGLRPASCVCEPVDLVTGPGNIYVAAAKRLLKGVVGIDSEAGPTEIAILADDTADPAHVAADLVSQAEHDPMAAAVLVTRQRAARGAVEAELARRVPPTKHARADRAPRWPARSRRSCSSTTSTPALEVVDAYAAEHLEIQTRDAAAVAARVHQRRRRLRRPVVAGLARRLLRGLQPRAAHRRLRLLLQRPGRARRSCAACR